MTWDHDGSRLTYQGVTYTYNMDDSIATAGATAFTYFATGARHTDGSHLYCFDGYDRLFRATTVTDVGCSAPTISYASDGLDRQRTHNEGSGSTYVAFDGLSNTISAEFPYNSPSGAGTVYALAAGRRVADGYYASGAVQSGTINYLIDDGKGNISTATAQGGWMLCTAWLDAWGVPMSPLSSTNPCNTGSTSNTVFYRGSRRDIVTGDYQFGVRTYDPSTGNFLQPDTYLGSQPGTQGSVVSDPLTRNRYVYVNGDPLNLIDPSGHMAVVGPLTDSSSAAYVDYGQPGGGVSPAQATRPGASGNQQSPADFGQPSSSAAPLDPLKRCLTPGSKCGPPCALLCMNSATNTAQDENYGDLVSSCQAGSTMALTGGSFQVMGGSTLTPDLALGFRLSTSVDTLGAMPTTGGGSCSLAFASKGKRKDGGGGYGGKPGGGKAPGGWLGPAMIGGLFTAAVAALYAESSICQANSCVPDNPACRSNDTSLASGTRIGLPPFPSPRAVCPTPDREIIKNPEG